MKYLYLVFLILVGWTLFDLLILKNRSQGGSGSVIDELKYIARNFHIMMGVLAILVIVFFLARLLYYGLKHQ